MSGSMDIGYGIFNQSNANNPKILYNSFWGNPRGDYFDDKVGPILNGAIINLFLKGAEGNIGDETHLKDAHDYDLTAISPCINAATDSIPGVEFPTTDILGRKRPSGAGYDIGAYEYQENAVIPTPTGSICDNLTEDTNLAAYGTAIAENYRGIQEPKLAIDKDIETQDNGWGPDNGMGWWQVQLPCSVYINRIEVFSNVHNPSDFFPSFFIAASLTGEFKGEETPVVTENAWAAQNPQKYEFSPVYTRYLRLIPLKPHDWALLQEFRAYPKVGITPTPTPGNTNVKTWPLH